MKYLNILSAITALVIPGLLACQRQHVNEGEIPLIDIEEALKNPLEIKLSSLGSKITYVPLELTDSALIGESPIGFCVTSKYIFVSNNMMFSNGECMAFDRNTGKFIALVGHLGQDPQAYSSPEPVFDYKSEKITFPGNGDNLVVYTPEGVFDGFVSIPLSTRNINTYVFDENDIIIYDGAEINSSSNNLLRLSSKGERLDSLNVFNANKNIHDNDNEVNSMMVRNSVGTIPGFVFITSFRNETLDFKYRDFRWLWNFKDDIRFYDNMRDTIYNYSENKFIPKYAVNIGNYPDKTHGEAKIMEEMPIIRTFFETSDLMLFYGNAGLMTGQFFAGIYNKPTGVTQASIITTGIFQFHGFENDIDGFMPILPVTMSEKEEFAALLTVEKIHSWIEEHPDYQFAPEISWIKDLDEDSNPVVAIISK